MKKLFLCVLFLMCSIVLLAFSRRQINFRIENKTDGEMIVTTEIYASSTNYSSSIYVYPITNERVPPGTDFTLMRIVKKEELREVPPLETFNDVFFSLKVSDSMGNIILTEKDLTNASFSVVWDDDICIIEVTNER